jgi:hypothetical protein
MDYFNYPAPHSEKRNTFQYSLSGTFGESYNSSKSSWGNYYQADMFNYINGTPPTPSGYIYGQSEGAGRSIMVPSTGRTPNHQRRSTFGGGTSKEFASSLSTTASPPRTPRRGSPATGSFKFENTGWAGGNIENSSRSEKKSCDLKLMPVNLEEFDDERR